MSDAPPVDGAPAPVTEPSAEPPAQEPPAAPETDVVKLQADLDKWKAMSRKNEADAKANREAAAELAEIKKQQMTETERLNAELAEARTAAEQARTEALRLKVATSKGLDPVLAERLRGATEDEMAEDADRLLAVMPKPPASPGSADGGPQGSVGPTQWKQSDMAGKTPEQIVAADAAGLLEDLKNGRV